MFTPYESILGEDDRSEIFFQYLKDVAMATNFVENGAKLPTHPCTYRSIIPKRNGITPCICMNKLRR